jgi:hypothetical protein
LTVLDGALTTTELPMRARVWTLDAAHGQCYLLSAPYHRGTISVGPFPRVSDKQAVSWNIQRRGPSHVTFAAGENAYLGCQEDGAVGLFQLVTDAELWSMETLPCGAHVFQNKQYDRILSWYKDEEEEDSSVGMFAKFRKEAPLHGMLTTISNAKLDHYEDNEMWRLDPCMPRAVSSAKIKTFAAGTAIAIAMTAAMPFAAAGAIGLLGAEAGILADIVVVGLTGAEAIASIGVVGTTAALVFWQSGDSLSINSEEATHLDGGQRRFMKRPFCAWQSW